MLERESTAANNVYEIIAPIGRNASYTDTLPAI